jgi:tRNA-2-methylthio-N6-dimethylallyladenosine synthase
MAEHLRDKVQSTPHTSASSPAPTATAASPASSTAPATASASSTSARQDETYDGLDGVPEDDGVSGQISIQRGCDKFCTFCVVPYTRGRERGVAPREVLRAARGQLAERGYKEVVLLGQTVNSYAGRT